MKGSLKPICPMCFRRLWGVARQGGWWCSACDCWIVQPATKGATPGEPHYSELTPGSDFSLSCGKRYWEFDQVMDGLDDFRNKLLSAERCADFKGRE
jgi:hypothetical protein